MSPFIQSVNAKMMDDLINNGHLEFKDPQVSLSFFLPPTPSFNLSVFLCLSNYFHLPFHTHLLTRSPIRL